MKYFILEKINLLMLFRMILFLLLLIPSLIRAQDLPKKAVIITPSYKNLAVREGPPKATAFSYQLDKMFCSIGVGTIFIAHDRLNVVNGEIWYRISFKRSEAKKLTIYDKTKISGDTITGWMVGKLKTQWVISFDSMLVSNYKIIKSTTDEATLTEDNLEEGSTWILLKYLFIFLGSVAAVSIISIERTRKFNPKEWGLSIFIFEILVLGIANILFGILMLESLIQEYQAAMALNKGNETSIIIKIIAIFAEHNFGFLILHIPLKPATHSGFKYTSRII